MDPFTPVRVGVSVATHAVKLATAVPKAIAEHALRHGRNGDDRYAPAPGATTPPPGSAAAPAPGPSATRVRAATTTPDVQGTKSPPDPTSAAGASGGVGGTVKARGAAAAVDAPDPTAATTARARRTAPRGARTQRDTTAAPISQVKTVDDSSTLRESEGSAAPAANLRVDEPWPNYTKMKAPDVVDRLRTADDATKAVVRLYEQTHKKRRSILTATGG